MAGCCAWCLSFFPYAAHEDGWCLQIQRARANHGRIETTYRLCLGSVQSPTARMSGRLVYGLQSRCSQSVRHTEQETSLWSACLGRLAREPVQYLEHRKRTWRKARSTIHTVPKERWSAGWLRRAWNYRARSSTWENPPASGILDGFRDGGANSSRIRRA